MSHIGSEDPTYELRTNKDEPDASTFDDLAALVRSVSGVDQVTGFDSAAYRSAVEQIFDVQGFLRWGWHHRLLLGSWDTYYGTPGNYFLYNSGRAGRERDFMIDPYFTFLPWDYDNILGITYDTTQRIYRDTDWAGGSIIGWPMSRARVTRRSPASAVGQPVAEQGLPALLPRSPDPSARHHVRSRHDRGQDRSRRALGSGPPSPLSSNPISLPARSTPGAISSTTTSGATSNVRRHCVSPTGLSKASSRSRADAMTLHGPNSRRCGCNTRRAPVALCFRQARVRCRDGKIRW